MNAKDVEARVAAIRDWFANCANYESEKDWKAVIGISGGKDSSVAAALLAKAVGPTKVFGVLMPNGEQKDIDDSYDLVRFLGINSGTVNIGGAFEALIDRLDVAWNDEGFFRSYGDDSRVTTNLPARLRMCVLYAVANHLNGRVIGTGNRSEKLTGYWTYGGDGLSDLAVLDDLYVSEVIELGELLGLPERFTRKPPSDGMSGKTDEEKLGFSYDELEKTVRLVDFPEGSASRDREAMIWDRVHGMAWKRRLIAGIPSVRDYMEG